MSPLPTYRVFVTPVRATVATFQRCGDRAVFDGSAAGGLYPGHSRGAGRITEHALPAWPILGTPVPETGTGACAALVAWTTPVAASSFVLSALHMLQSIGWIAAHGF